MLHCLLIIPKHFYSFKDHFKAQLESRGYIVIVANDEYPEGKLGLLLGKLKIPVQKKITYKRIVETFLKEQDYDLVVIFKGRGISPSLIEALKKCSKRIIGYNYDSFEFNSSPLNWMLQADKYCTFDIKNAQDKGVQLVELFSTLDKSKLSEKKNAVYKFSAVFRNHSNRLKYLDKVVNHFDIKEEDIFIYIFEQNIFFKLINFLNSPLLYLKYRKWIYSDSLNYDDYLKSIRESIYTLDYAHPKQTGLTMRCFDALNMRTKIITNNRYIHSSPTFNGTQPIVYDMKTDQHMGDVDFQNVLSTTKSRTIQDFMDELLG